VVFVTLGVIERERPALATMIALACESVGHDCLVFKDIAQATRVIHAIRLDKIVIAVEGPGLNALDWLETMAPSWPDLPPRTLLLVESELAPRDVARIQELGAEVVYTPSSLADAKRVVLERFSVPPFLKASSVKASGRESRWTVFVP
jgi:DNA-binding response OmpR family regulator